MHSSRRSENPSINLHEETLRDADEEIEYVDAESKTNPETPNPVIITQALTKELMAVNRPKYMEYDAIDTVKVRSIPSTSGYNLFTRETQSAPETVHASPENSPATEKKVQIVVVDDEGDDSEMFKPNLCCGITMMIMTFFSRLIDMCGGNRPTEQEVPVVNDESHLLDKNKKDEENFDAKSEASGESDKTAANGKRRKAK